MTSVEKVKLVDMDVYKALLNIYNVYYNRLLSSLITSMGFLHFINKIKRDEKKQKTL